MIRPHPPVSSLLAVSLLAGLSGCSVSALSSSPGAGEAKVTITPRLLAGGYAAQALVSPYKANDVHHLVLTLSTVNGPQVIPVATADVPKADLQENLVFAKLKPQTTYRITAQAYKAAGTALDDLISKDASSSIELSTGYQDSHAITIPVQLVDRAFSGTTLTPGVSVTDGAFLPSGSVTVATQSVNP